MICRHFIYRLRRCRIITILLITPMADALIITILWYNYIDNTDRVCALCSISYSRAGVRVTYCLSTRIVIVRNEVAAQRDITNFNFSYHQKIRRQKLTSSKSRAMCLLSAPFALPFLISSSNIWLRRGITLYTSTIMIHTREAFGKLYYFVNILKCLNNERSTSNIL